MPIVAQTRHVVSASWLELPDVGNRLMPGIVIRIMH